MLVKDVLNSCLHGEVAEAAVVSIGGQFAGQVKSSAKAEGQSIGEFTSSRVRQFSQFATERDWRVVASRMRGEDLPLLAGLEALMQRMMVQGRSL